MISIRDKDQCLLVLVCLNLEVTILQDIKDNHQQVFWISLLTVQVQLHLTATFTHPRIQVEWWLAIKDSWRLAWCRLDLIRLDLTKWQMCSSMEPKHLLIWIQWTKLIKICNSTSSNQFLHSLVLSQALKVTIKIHLIDRNLKLPVLHFHIWIQDLSQ
jgi:hypothetical protein